MSEADIIEQTRELLDGCTLNDVGYYELSAFRGTTQHDKSASIIGPGPVDDLDIGDGADTHELGVYWTSEGDKLLVRMLTAVATSAGEIRVGAQAEYTFRETRRKDIHPEVEESFVNRVAIMALVPYLRAAISDLSVKVFGVSLTMGIVKPGEVAFSRKATSTPVRSI